MAIEIRRIIFQPDELTGIIKRNFSPTDPTVQGGVVMMVDLADEHPLQATAHIQKEGRTLSVRLNEDDLIGCLIAFCLKHRIPMAKGARKSLNKNDKGFAFDMVIQANVGD